MDLSLQRDWRGGSPQAEQWEGSLHWKGTLPSDLQPPLLCLPLFGPLSGGDHCSPGPLQG